MGNVTETIKEARKRGAEDERIFNEILRANPQKAEVLTEARRRGADATLILEKIIEENKLSDSEIPPAPEKTTPEIPPAPKKATSSRKEEVTDLKEKLKEKISALANLKLVGNLLPGTRYLLMGVDISDHSIEILLLGRSGAISSYGRSVLKAGAVQNGEILNQKILSETLKKTLEKAGPRPLEVPEHTREKKSFIFEKRDYKSIVTLPDSKTFIHIFDFETRKDLYRRIKERAEETIPFKMEDLYWDFSEIRTDKPGVRVLFVATLRDIADTYIHFFKSTNIEPVAFDIEGASIGRALLPLDNLIEKEKEVKMKDGRPRMIIDMGARTSVLNVFNKNGSLAVSVSLPYAGHYFTKKIADHFDISNDEAERLKRKNGFLKGTETFPVLEDHGKKIIREINQAERYYQKEFNEKTEEIILAGGTSLLPGIEDFFQENFSGKRVRLGSPLDKIDDRGLIDSEKAILYANVVGLGLRALTDNPIKTGINLLPDEVMSQTEKREKKKLPSVSWKLALPLVLGVILIGLIAYYLAFAPAWMSVEPFRERIFPGAATTEDITGTEEVTTDTGVAGDPGMITIVDSEDPVQAKISPDPDSPTAFHVESGSDYQVLEASGNWVLIETRDQLGWIKAENIEGGIPDNL